MKDQLFVLKKQDYKKLNLKLVNKFNSIKSIDNDKKILNIYNEHYLIENYKYFNILIDNSTKNSNFINRLFKNFILFQGKGLRHFRDSITKELYVISLVNLQNDQVFLFDKLLSRLKAISNSVNMLYQINFKPKKLEVIETSLLSHIDYINSVIKYNNLLFYNINKLNKFTVVEPVLWNRVSIGMFFYRLLLNLIQELAISSSVDISTRWFFYSGKTFDQFLRFLNIYSNNYGVYKRMKRQRFYFKRRYLRRVRRLQAYSRYRYIRNRLSLKQERRLVIKVQKCLIKRKKIALIDKLFDYKRKGIFYKNKYKRLAVLNPVYNNYRTRFSGFVRNYRYKLMVSNLGPLFNYKQIGVFKVWGLFYTSIMYKFMARRLDRRNFLQLRHLLKRKFMYQIAMVGPVKLKFKSQCYMLGMVSFLMEYTGDIAKFRLNFYNQLKNGEVGGFIENYYKLNKFIVWCNFFAWFYDNSIIHFYNNYYRRHKRDYLLIGLHNRFINNFRDFQSGLVYLVNYYSDKFLYKSLVKSSYSFILLYLIFFINKLKLANINHNSNSKFLVIYNYLFKIIGNNKLTSSFDFNSFNSMFILFFSKIIISSLIIDKTFKANLLNNKISDILILDQVLKLSLPRIYNKKV